MRHRLLGRLLFLGGCGAWAWRAAGLLPSHLYKFNYLDSADWGLWGANEWVHPLFVPLLGAYRAVLGLAGYCGTLVLPLAALNLIAGWATLLILFLAAERFCRDSLLAASGVLAVGLSSSFMTGTLGMNPYALGAVCSAASLALLAWPLGSRRSLGYAGAGAAAGLAAGFHTAGIALVPAAVAAAWLEPEAPRGAARRLALFLGALAAVLVAVYAVFLVYHGIAIRPIRRSDLVELFLGVEQVRGISIFTSGSLVVQLRNFWGTLHEGGTFLLFLAGLAALRGIARLRRAAPGLDPAQRRAAAVAAVGIASYAVFFTINGSFNGFVYSTLLGVPLLLAVLGGGERLGRAVFLPAALAAVVVNWERGAVAAEVWHEARFLNALMRPGDVLVLPGRPLPDLLYLGPIPVLEAGAPAGAVGAVAPAVPLPELPRRIAGILGQGRRVFFQAGDAAAQFRDGQGGIDSALLHRQLFMVERADPAERARRVLAVTRRLDGAFAMDCRYRSAQGWEYCRLALRRRKAGAAGLRPPSRRAAALAEALLSARVEPLVRRKTRYLLDWLRTSPQDAFILDELEALAAANIRGEGALRAPTAGQASLLLHAEHHLAAGRRSAAWESLRRLPLSSLDDAQIGRAAGLYWGLGEYGALAEFIARAGAEGRRLDAGLWLRGAEAAQRAGRRELARRALERVERLGLDDERLPRVEGIYRGLGDDAALAEFLMRAGEGRRSRDAGLWLRGAEAARRAGRRELARRALERVEGLGLDGARFSQVAGLYWELGEYERLGGLAARSGAGGGVDVGLWAQRVETARRGGDAAGARAALAVAEASSRIEPRLLCRLGISACALGDLETGRRLFKRLETDPGQDAGFWLSLARASALAGDDKAAEHAWGRSAQSEGGDLAEAEGRARLLGGAADAAVWAGLAGMAARAGDAGRARSWLREAEGAAGGAAELRSVALVYQGLGDHAAALRLYDRLVAQEPGQARWLGDRGVLQALLGRSEAAIADLEAALARDPSLIAAHLTLGALYAARGDEEKARRCYEQAARRVDGRTPAALKAMIRGGPEGR